MSYLHFCPVRPLYLVLGSQQTENSNIFTKLSKFVISRSIVYVKTMSMTMSLLRSFAFFIALNSGVAPTNGDSTLKTANFVEFPPKFVPSSDPAILAGHLKPFGYQKPPLGPVKEYKTVLHPQDFWEKHVSQNFPLVFRGALKESPAIRRWTDEYLKEKYGDLDVLTEVKKENRTHGESRRLTLARFIDGYKKENIYVVTVLPDPMREEVQVLPCLLCGTFKDFLHETNLWISNGGTRSVIHFDADHNIHCMVAGSKDFIMIDQKFKKELDLLKFPQFGSGFSIVDPDVIDLNKYPDFAKVDWTYTTINTGDCIFIPSGYIHLVRAHVRSISVTMLFTASPDDTFEPVGCENETFEYTPMSKVKVHWTYNKGDRIIEMGYMNVEKLRKMFLTEFKEQNADRLPREEAITFLEESFHRDAEADLPSPEEVFDKIIDTKGKGYITTEDFKKMSREKLKEIARAVDVPHGPVAGAHDDEGLEAKARANEHVQNSSESPEGDGESTERDEL